MNTNMKLKKVVHYRGHTHIVRIQSMVASYLTSGFFPFVMVSSKSSTSSVFFLGDFRGATPSFSTSNRHLTKNSIFSTSFHIFALFCTNLILFFLKIQFKHSFCQNLHGATYVCINYRLWKNLVLVKCLFSFVLVLRLRRAPSLSLTSIVATLPLSKHTDYMFQGYYC